MTKIEWADATWNPVTGCSPVSSGCTNCYAKRMANRLKGRYGYPKDEPFRPGIVHQDKLDQPRKWQKSRKIFVCSMGDLFHPDVNRATVEDMCETVYDCKRHIFMMLTKRPEAMLDFFGISLDADLWGDNLWLGVTAENQKRYDERWPILSKIPAAVKFVSIEPALEYVNIDIFAPWPDWVIAGPETGPGARECKPEWIESLYEQCKEAGVPFFDKRKENYLAREFPNG